MPKKNIKIHTSPNNFKREGEDHINISIHSSTPLGKLLDPNYIKVINYPNLGKFSSVKSMWHWLHSDYTDDKIKKTVGVALSLSVKEKRLYGKLVPNFRAMIGYATWLKVKEYPELLKDLALLPDSVEILSYYTHSKNNIRIENSYANVMIPIAKELQVSARCGVEPNFKCIADLDESSSTDYVPNELLEKLKTLTEETV